MSSDWDFINEHMGGHDANGLPNFVHNFHDFKEEEYDDRYVVYDPYRPVEKYPTWIGPRAPLGKLLGLSVEKALAIEALRALAWSLKTRCDSANVQFEVELSSYEYDKAEFEAGYAAFCAEDLGEKKALVDEKELTFEIAFDEFTVINNAYSRASWLAHQPVKERAVLSTEAKLPPEKLFELLETQVQGVTYPLFEATTQLSIELNRKLVLDAVKNDDSALGYASGIFKFDRKMVLDAVKSDGSALDGIFDTFETFKDDQELLLEAVKEYSWALDDATDSFTNDRESVLDAIKNHGFDLRDASDALKDDRELVLEAVRHHGFSLKYASDSLKGDRELVLEAVRLDNSSLNYATDALKDDRELVLEAVRHHGLSLSYASDALKDDREVVLEAVRHHGYSLRYASDTLKADQELQNIEDIWLNRSF
jgi:hypothetical protein